MPTDNAADSLGFQIPAALVTCMDGRLAAAISLAVAAGRSTLDFFQTSKFSVVRKGDNSPVTAADHRAEELIRQQLEHLYPHDAILGEEFGVRVGTSPYQWIVDPIDGTKSFISGVPLYSTLVGIVQQRECLAGVIYIPALDEIVFAARGLGAWYSARCEPPTRCQVSSRSLAEGLFLTSQVDTFCKRGAQNCFDRLQKSAYITRTWGDGYGYLLVATGRAEIMVDPIANPWDLAAVQPIVEEAGGRFSDWRGNSSVFGGDGVGSNSVVYDEVMQALSDNR